VIDTRTSAFPKPKDQKRSPRIGLIVYPDGREVCRRETRKGREIYRERLWLMLVRQGHRCKMCKKRLTLERATFDHENGRGSGGGHRDDRIERLDVEGKLILQNAALCYVCNMAKGSKRGYD